MSPFGRRQSMEAMNLLLTILLGTGAVIGALGMVLLIAGGIAASMMDGA